MDYAPKPIEIPPAAARSFVKDMRLFRATSDGTKRDEIAARQAWLLSRHGQKIRPFEIRELFDLTRDQVD